MPNPFRLLQAWLTRRRFGLVRDPDGTWVNPQVLAELRAAVDKLPN